MCFDHFCFREGVRIEPNITCRVVFVQPNQTDPPLNLPKPYPKPQTPRNTRNTTDLQPKTHTPQLVNRTPHTSHFSQCFTPNDTHTRGSSRKFGVRTSHSMSHLHALMLCV